MENTIANVYSPAYSLSSEIIGCDPHEGEVHTKLENFEVRAECFTKSLPNGTRSHRLHVLHLGTGLVSECIRVGNFPKLSSYTELDTFTQDTRELLVKLIKIHANSAHLLFNV